jgi:hypothetical protein
MAITDQLLDQAFAELKDAHGGQREDYLGPLYLMQEFGLERERALSQVALGGTDYGIDGFHFAGEKRNLYLYQFKYSKSYRPFKTTIPRLIEVGMEKVFGANGEESRADQLLRQIHACLLENEAVIDRVFIQFVFTGEPEEARNSQALDKLREDLSNKKYLVEQRFRRPVTLSIGFWSATRGPDGWPLPPANHSHEVVLDKTISRPGPGDERMTVGFIRLLDLQAMYRGMGQRFFERNIRASLSDEEAVNRAIHRSLTGAVLEGKEDPRTFAFNHNGVTLSAVKLEERDGKAVITEPRLLNGAQTVTTFDRFMRANEAADLYNTHREAVEHLCVMCRIITGASAEFITGVTINNNRQNPVDPSNLHANDMIQLEIQDKLREELGIYYERQERAFANLSDDTRDDLGIKEQKAVELTQLARTFIVSDGAIDRLNGFRDVFEDERIYNEVFPRERLDADYRKVILCYKTQFRLGRLAKDIVECGANKYAYIPKARNLLWALLCQGILNDDSVEQRAEDFGRGLTLETAFTDWLSNLATTRCRFILSDLTEDKQYAEKANDGSFSFMRTSVAWKRSMEIAAKRYGWVERSLK